jgi:branched-chain amino acid aminotransferase
VKRPRFAFFEGKIVPYEKAKIGVMTHALNYGTGAFAGVRAYWNSEQEQLFIFRPRDHFKRFTNSWKIINAHLDYGIEDLIEIVRELLRKEGYREDCYIRPLVYKADEVVGVRLHDLRDELTMFAVPFTRYIERDEGAHVTFSAWRRIDDNAVPARAKLTGAYINSALIKTDAVRSGFDEALVLTNQGHVSEGSAENIFMLRDGELITPPVTENILEGITRRTVMQLAREQLDLPVTERLIDRTEIYLCDELFMTGTAAQVTAIVSVDHHPIGEGVMGSVTTNLRALYGDVVRGRIEKYHAWNEAVYVREAEPAR